MVHIRPGVKAVSLKKFEELETCQNAAEKANLHGFGSALHPSQLVQ
jgi:hypothetical protein